MKKTTKVWLIIGTCLFLVGVILFTVVMTVLKWDFRKISTREYQTKEYVMEENYQNISIEVAEADITFLFSEDNKTTVICYEQTVQTHAVAVINNTLVIEVQEKKKNLLDYIEIDFQTPKITVEIPQAQYNDIAIQTSTGDVSVEHLYSNTLDVCVSTGRISLSDIECHDLKTKVSTGKLHVKNSTCENFTSNGSTGDVYLTNVIATKKIHIERNTGDVEFEDCDGVEIFIKTSTGDVEGDFLTGKTFLVKTSTGEIEVPKDSTGGTCEITTSTGDIEIEIRD